jgi:hypothetical protein
VIFGGFAEHDAPAVLLLKGLFDPKACVDQVYCLSLPPTQERRLPFYKGPARREQAVDSWS